MKLAPIKLVANAGNGLPYSVLVPIISTNVSLSHFEVKRN